MSKIQQCRVHEYREKEENKGTSSDHEGFLS